MAIVLSRSTGVILRQPFKLAKIAPDQACLHHKVLINLRSPNAARVAIRRERVYNRKWRIGALEVHRPNMNTIICPSCHSANRTGANYCVVCGHRLQATTVLSSPVGGLSTQPLVGGLSSAPATVTSGEPANGPETGQGRRAGLRVGYRTDVGRLRQLNEDSLLSLELGFSNRSKDYTVNLFIIADGMGGHENGEVASGLLVHTMTWNVYQSLLRDDMPGGSLDDLETWLVEVVKAGNRQVYERAQQTGSDMGTTVVAALFVDHRAMIAHVGDSRAYHLGTTGIRQLTIDHSLVERLVAAGEITRQQARHHPHAHVIIRTIGDEPTVEVDVTHQQLAQGDSLVLCSDGLSGMINDETIHQLVVGAESPQAACEALVAAANAAGGEDNVTVIVIQPEFVA